MSTQQLDQLLDEATKVATQLGDPTLLKECERIVQPARTYQAEIFAKLDPLGLVRSAWKDYAKALGTSLDQVRDVFSGTIADMRNVRDGLVGLVRIYNDAEATRLASTAMGPDVAASPATGDVFGDMRRHTTDISEQLRKFVRLAEVVPLLNRVIEIDREIEVLEKEYGNPRRRLRRALRVIRGIRALNYAARAAVNAAIYVGLFALSYFYDDFVKDFVAGLIAGEIGNYVKLFGVMLAIELIKGKIVDLIIEKPLRSWEARATGREMTALSGLGVKTWILIARMKAALAARGGTPVPAAPHP